MFTYKGIAYYVGNETGDVVASQTGSDGWVHLDENVQRAARQAELAGQTAMGYVWGRVDGGLSVSSELQSTFRNAYAAHTFAYYLGGEGVGMRTNVRDALKYFLDGRDMSGRKVTSDGRPALATVKAWVNPTPESV